MTSLHAITKRQAFLLLVLVGVVTSTVSSSKEGASSSSSPLLRSSSSSSPLSPFASEEWFLYNDNDSNNEVEDYQHALDEHEHLVHELEQRHRDLQSSNPRVIAEAYECNEDNTPLEPYTRPKPIGSEVRICIRPNFPTVTRGVFLRKIQKFVFAKDFGIGVQEVIRKGTESDEIITLQLCFPGATVCAFKTKLRDVFFYGDTNGTITGSGEVQMQFGRTIDGRRRRLINVPIVMNGGVSVSSESESIDDYPGNDHEDALYGNPLLDTTSTTSTTTTTIDRDLQNIETAHQNFAGFTGVRIQIPVAWAKAPRNFFRSQTSRRHWWYDSPLWVRILIIIWLVLMFLFGCGVCCWFLFCPGGLFKPREQKEKKIVHEETEEHNVVHHYQDEDDAPRNNGDDEEDEDDQDPDLWAKYSSSDFTSATQDQQRDLDDEVIPTDFDVCFEADDHPGTEAFDKAVTKTAESFGPDEAYAPPVYRAIKKELPGRKFFVCDDERYPDNWREVGKRELIELFGQKFDEKKDELYGGGGRNANDGEYDDDDDDYDNTYRDDNTYGDDTYGDNTRDDTYNSSYNNGSFRGVD